MIDQKQFLKLRRGAMNGLQTNIQVYADMLTLQTPKGPFVQDYDIVVKACGEADLERILNLMGRREVPVDPKYSPITWRKALRKDMIDSLPNIHDHVQQSHIARSLGEIENEITVLEYNEAAKQDDYSAMDKTTGQAEARVPSSSGLISGQGQTTFMHQYTDEAILKAATIRGILK